MASGGEDLQNGISVASVRDHQNFRGRPGLAKAAKAADSLHPWKVVIDHRQADARSILSENSADFPEVPANDHFGKVQAGFHDVKEPGAAECVFISHYRYVMITSQGKNPPLTSRIRCAFTERPDDLV